MPERILRIGVDIDDVLFQSAQRSIDLYNRAHGTGLTLEDWYTENTDLAYWRESWGSDDREVLVSRVVGTNASDDFRSVEVIDGALNELQKLKQRGHELFAVTGRPEAIRPQTIVLLDASYPGIFHNDTLFFVDHFEHDGTQASKADVARNLNLTHFIDDLPAHANAVAGAGVRTVLFDPGYPWAKRPVDSSVTRLKSWEQIGFFLYEEAGR